MCVCVCVCVAYVGKMPQCIRTLVFDTYNVRYGVSSLKSWQKCESRGSVNRRRWRTGDSIHEDSCETSSDSARECLRVRVHSTYEIRDTNTKEEEKKNCSALHSNSWNGFWGVWRNTGTLLLFVASNVLTSIFYIDRYIYGTYHILRDALWGECRTALHFSVRK